MGIGLGGKVGIGDGCCVGTGEIDGSSVGTPVGTAVGVLEGMKVGTGVGKGVGADVGALVGLRVCMTMARSDVSTSATWKVLTPPDSAT